MCPTVALLLLLAFALPCRAQSAVDNRACVHRASGRIDFRSAGSGDRFVVSTSPGPCKTTRLTLEIRGAQGHLLYRFSQRAAQLVLPGDVDGPLSMQMPSLVSSFAKTVHEPVQRRLSLEELTSGPTADLHQLKVSRSDYGRLVASTQPFLSHATYYEGGVTVAFDPLSKRSRVLYSSGL